MKQFLIYASTFVLFIAIGTTILACNNNGPQALATQSSTVHRLNIWYVPPTERFVNACYSHGQLNALITVERTKADTLYQTYHVTGMRDIGPDLVVDIVESK